MFKLPISQREQHAIVQGQNTIHDQIHNGKIIGIIATN